MQKIFKRALPSGIELGYVALAAFALLLVGNAKFILQRYGLIGPSALVQRQLAHGVGSGLQYLDSFNITAGAVNFIIWSLVGLVGFSVVQALLKATGIIRFERDLSSNRYVHPQNFDRKVYWRHIVTDAAISFILLALLAAVTALYVVIIVPTALNYTQQFIISSDMSHLGSLAIGAVTAFAGTFVVYALWKLVVWHHRASVR